MNSYVRKDFIKKHKKVNQVLNRKKIKKKKMFLMCPTFVIKIFSEYLNQSNQLNEIFIKF